MSDVSLEDILSNAPDLDLSRFAILRHEIYFNFVARSCPIPEEKFTIDDLIAIIRDVGHDYIGRNRAGIMPSRVTE